MPRSGAAPRYVCYIKMVTAAGDHGATMGVGDDDDLALDRRLPKNGDMDAGCEVTFREKNLVIRTIVLAIAALILNGCHRPDTDVTTSPYYNFSPFTNTLWETKVKVAVTDMRRYNGEHAITLVEYRRVDRTDPSFAPVSGVNILSILPLGTRLRIDRLMKDNGNWGGVRVTAQLEGGEYTNKTVFLDGSLLSANQFIAPLDPSTNWSGEPKVLGKCP